MSKQKQLVQIFDDWQKLTEIIQDGYTVAWMEREDRFDKDGDLVGDLLYVVLNAPTPEPENTVTMPTAVHIRLVEERDIYKGLAEDRTVTPQPQTIESGDAMRKALTDAGELRGTLHKIDTERIGALIKLAEAEKERDELRELFRQFYDIAIKSSGKTRIIDALTLEQPEMGDKIIDVLRLDSPE